MAKTTGLSVDQLKAKISELKSQGKTESNSKELGKYVDALKVLTPEKYGAETVASAKKKLASSTQPLSDLNSSISGSNGLGNLGMTGSGVNLNQIYNDAMNSEDLVNLQNELKAKKEAKVRAETDVNDNPFYAEVTRTGKLAKIQEAAQSEIANIESEVALKKADAQTKVNIALQQYNIDDKNYQNQLQKLNLLISSGAITNATSQNIADIALATGISTDMVKGIINTTKQNQQKLQVATDDNGNVTIYDLNTGKVVNTIAGIDNKKSSSGNTLEDKKAQEFQSVIYKEIEQLQKGENWGTVWNRIKKQFPDAPDDLIDSMLGTQWREGGAYEAYKKKQTTA